MTFHSYQEWPHSDVGQLPQHLWVHHVRTYELVYILFV